MPSADLYLFSSPGRMGKPIRDMRRFLKQVELLPGARYALLTTEIAPQPEKRTGRMPTEEEICRFQRVRPILNEILQGKGLVKIAEDKALVVNIKGRWRRAGRRRWRASLTVSPSRPDRWARAPEQPGWGSPPPGE
jgi:hypothetical protein